MSDSNRYSYSQSRRVTITLHPLYGGAGGNRTRVRNSYMNKTFLRNRRFFSVALQRALAIPSNLSQGVQWFAHLHHLISFHSNKENCKCWINLLTSDAYLHPAGASFWKILHQSGSNPLSHESGESGMDHNDSFSVVVSFLFKP